MPPFTPTKPQHWEEYKDRIIDLYQVRNMELAELAQEMKRLHRFNATPRMYLDRLHQWGYRRYMTEKIRDDLCNKLVDDLHHGRDISYVTCNEIRRLRRHYKGKTPRSSPELLEDLKAIELAICLSGSSREVRDERQSVRRNDSRSSTTNHLPTEQLYDDDVMQSEPVLLEPNDGMADISGFSYLGIGDESDAQNDYDTSCFSSVLDMPTPAQTVATDDDLMVTNWSTNLPPSLINQFARIAENGGADIDLPMQISFGGTALATENLLHLAHSYYTARICENINVTNLSSITLTAESKSFWTQVKSAIYMLKKQDEVFPFAILKEVGSLVPRVAAIKQLSLLRELLTTLSIVNTNVCPGIRSELLRLFARTAYSPGQVDAQFHRLCVMLQQDWVCDEVLTIILCSIVRLAETHLEPYNNEVAELHRARIQLLRRRNDVTAADHVAVDAKRNVESFYGTDSVQTRLIMCEQIYILNKQKRLEESLAVAKDVIERAKRHDGIDFPSDRSIYHIEDIAEIYENLGQRSEAISWLRKALKAALRNWNNKPHANSLNNKLEKLYADM